MREESSNAKPPVFRSNTRLASGSSASPTSPSAGNPGGRTAEGGQAPEKLQPPSPGPSHTALVIDDEPQIRRLLRVTLEANGYRVFDAATGQDGIVQAAQRRPEVVLLDLGLPDL